MRSDLVFGALPGVPNRYQLCQSTAKAARKLHKPNARLQDTINDALVRLGSTAKAEGAVESAVSQLQAA